MFQKPAEMPSPSAAHLLRLNLIACVAVVASGSALRAQDAQPENAGQSSNLPPIVVVGDQQKKKPTKKKTAAKQKASGLSPTMTMPDVQQQAADPAQGSAYDPRLPQNRNDTGTDGFVATMTGVATKTPGTVLETPRSVSTVTKQEIEQRDAQSVYEAIQYSSGVNAYPFSGGFITREQALVRGFLAYQFLDGLKQHDSNWGIEPYGLERIDVLKGPASMLYGQGSPGGLIDLTSKRPTTDPFAEVVLMAGTHDKFQTGFDFGGPVGGNGVVSYRLTGLGRIADGEVDYTENNRLYIAPALTVRPDAATSFTLLASYQYDPNMTVQQPLPFVGTAVPGPGGKYISRDLFLGEPDYHDTSKESFKIGYELRRRFNDVLSFEQNAAYRHIDISLQELQGRGIMSGTSELREMFRADYLIDTYQADTRLRAEFNTGAASHNLVVGFDYANIPNYQGAGVFRGTSSFPLDLYNPVYGQPLGNNRLIQKRYQKFEQAGLYALDTVSIGDLTVVGGLRQDWASTAQKTRALNTSTGQFSNPPYIPKYDDSLTGQVGASYQLPGGIAPYVSYSQSFFPTPGTNYNADPFIPTTGDQYEAGIKYQPVGFNALFTAAVFDLTQQNVLTGDPDHPGYRIQTGEVTSRGVELEARMSLAEGWNVAAAYTYLDAEVTKTNTVGGVGKSPVYIPKNQASLWASYSFHETLLRGLTLGGGVRYFGESNGNALNTFKVPAFTLYDATLRYDLGVLSRAYENWELSVNAKNLMDERYVTNCEAMTSCYYGAGRVIDGALRMRF